MSTRRGIVVSVIVLLAACVRAQKEDPHSHLIDSAGLGTAGPAAPRPGDGWWHAFGDEQLDRLMDEAMAHNPSLDQALARVRAAGAQEEAAGAALKPSVTLDADETWQHFSTHYYIPPPYAGRRFWVGNVGFNLGWDLDFWGRQGDLIRKARAERVSAELDRIAARLALGGSIAQAYLDLNRAYAFGDIAARSLAQRERLLQLVHERLNTGLDTDIELRVAEGRVFDARNLQRMVENDRALAVHRLAALAGHGADYYDRIARPQLVLATSLPIPEALPVDLLSRRPDVLAARARVDAADSGRAATKAAFYPDISLKAFAGYQAIGLDTLFKSGSEIYGIGPAVHLPIFEANRLRAGYHAATAELDTAIATYNDVVLQAVRQTADQISMDDSLRPQIEDSRRSLAAAESVHHLAEGRFNAGLGNQLAVLNSESPVLIARRDLVSLETDLALARVTLLLTLGGSFNPQAPPTMARAGANHE